MKIKFIQGPWDGVEFEVTYAPEYVVLEMLAVEASKSEQLGIPPADPENPEFVNPLAFLMDMDETPREMQTRRARYSKEAETADLVTYKYALDEKSPWWEIGAVE